MAKRPAKTHKYYATGRRKTAVARVFASPGSGKFTVNGLELEKFFTRATCNMISLYPLEFVGLRDKLDFTATVRGGGERGQAGAISLGVSRVLTQHAEKIKPSATDTPIILRANVQMQHVGEMKVVLKREGLLTRDSRAVERKKVGLHKARRAKQFSKR